MSSQTMSPAEIISFESVSKFFPVTEFSLFGPKKQVKAVSDVSLRIQKGETFGLVGESGSGKSTIGKLAIRLIDPTAGKIVFEGRDISALKGSGLVEWRRNAQMIFQDPSASLPPNMKIGNILLRPLEIHTNNSRTENLRIVSELLEKVGLAPASNYIRRRPSQLSGGERQRAVIARALILKPAFVVADEPIAMLDVSLRAQIIELLRDLGDSFNVTYLLITHDLSVAGFLCDRIAVLYLGRIVEVGTTDEIFFNPQHPYTVALLSSIPEPDPKLRQSSRVQGEIPSPLNPPSGCHFHPRCSYAEASCKMRDPEFIQYSPTHFARCPVAPFAKRTVRKDGVNSMALNV